MTIFYCVASDGAYLGAYDDGSKPDLAIAVPNPPLSGIQRWDFVTETWSGEHRVTPEEITRRQFFQALASKTILEEVKGSSQASGIITESEALSALQVGSIPQALEDIINELPSDAAKFDARMLVVGATHYYRSNLFVDFVRENLGWSNIEVNKFWLLASEL